jgi:hypothetical protein
MWSNGTLEGIGCIYSLWFAAESISVGLWPFRGVRAKTKTKGGLNYVGYMPGGQAKGRNRPAGDLHR